MAEKNDKNLFRLLTKLFRSGPVVKRKVRTLDTTQATPNRGKSSGVLLFQRSSTPTYANITSNAYNLAERMMRYQDFQEMEMCLAGDTLIAVPDGFKRIDELANDCSHDPDHMFVVYSYDHEKKQIVPALAKQARQTCVEHAYRVKFDNGKELVGTGNHRLMLRDGTYLKIEELTPGQAMMPFYRKDLFQNSSSARGYHWIYTMDPMTTNGWKTEHKLIAEWAAKRELLNDEVVHHVNFVKTDNRPENLLIMKDHDHKSLHIDILNKKKWSVDNAEWISQFKKNHSKWMKENNPATRHDITFGRILETCERTGFSVRKLQNALDVDLGVICRRLRDNGFQTFETFARAYNPKWKSDSFDNKAEKNPRFDHALTFENICSIYSPTMDLSALTTALNTTKTKINNRLKFNGYKNFGDFKKRYENLKVVSIEYVGVMPLYDLTVDGYKNFATDSIVSHNTPEIASALDIYADEACSSDEKGRNLHVYSDNEKIKQELEELFYNTLNVEFNLRSWTRNTVKYGDNFLYNDVHPENGVLNVFPIPVNEIEREDNYDPNDPFAVRYRWTALGNRTLENWEVSHFRLLGNDMFLPYGSSVIEPARRIWRQLILAEDAMLVYRVTRAPERRVFKIDVGNISPDEVDMYMEEQRKNLRNATIVDPTTGRVDLRYNPFSVDEDYFLPVRGKESGTAIDTLQGGANTAAIEDVAYLQKKLFAALKVPRAYLGYDESLGSKATLAQEDIRFARTTSVIQKTMLAELNKIAIIHLFACGYTGDDLLNFNLRLSNPSTVSQQQKLELWRTRFEIAGSVPEGMVSKNFIRREIWGLNDEQCKSLDNERYHERIVDATLETLSPGGTAGEGSPSAGAAPGEGDAGLDDILGAGSDGEEGGEEGGTPPEENAGEEPENETQSDIELITSGDDAEIPDVDLKLDKNKLPVKVQKHLDKVLYNRSRHRTHGALKTHTPDFNRMMSNDTKSMNDPYDQTFLKSISTNPLGESIIVRSPIKIGLPPDVISSLVKMKMALNARTNTQNQSNLLSEDVKNSIDKNSDENSLFIIDEDEESDRDE